MDSIRFYALAVGLFFAVFLGGKWLLIPTVVPLQPDARLPTFQRLDWSLCKGSDHGLLMMAVRNYYGTRGREKHNFSLRGPRATAAIEQKWSTPLDRQIDDYVRHALHYGIVHKSDFPAKTYPEFAHVFADTEEFGVGCTGTDSR